MWRMTRQDRPQPCSDHLTKLHMHDTVSEYVRCLIEAVVCSGDDVSQVVVSDIAAKAEDRCGQRAPSR
jgi:hypothetical protein